jgi:hypothetical protein
MHHARRIIELLGLTALLFLAGCGMLPFNNPLNSVPTPSRQISYDGAVTMSIHAGETLPGTGIAYQGRAPDGRAIMSINGLQALKSTADSVNWSGALVLFSLVDLNLRVLTYDDSGMTLAGTIHVVVQEPNPTPAALNPNPTASFTIPVTFTVPRSGVIPGTTVGYVGARPNGAEFSNLDQVPFRERFDSVVWEGYLRERIALRMDVRVVDFNDDRVILGGTARISFEP